ncbi:hypothetical protein [Zavarzinia sp.]|uniref:hypothetical protein n=1 Tax=Zavarzinia sp. TaxID=2027920 RepID=UPI003563B186
MRSLLIFMAACLLGACARGQDVARPTMASVVLGGSTEAQIVQAFGTPSSRRQQVAPVPSAEQLAAVKSPFDAVPAEGGYSRIEYEYSKPDGLDGTGGGTRVCFFAFMNDRLISYDWISGFADNSSQFDESRIASIKRGATTKAQIVELLGEPTGQAIYPAVRDKGMLLLSYSYVGLTPRQRLLFDRSRQIVLSFLEVLIAPDGKVVDYRSRSETKPMPQAPASSPTFMPIFIPTK